MATGWRNDAGKWYYLNESGAMATGWKAVNGKWYYLNNSGDMATGWKAVNGKWYYMNAAGDMATGWKAVNGKWYHLDNSGSMSTGWLADNGNWYYLDNWGSMATGWRLVNNTWYYMDNSGSMETGFFTVGDNTYFASSDGAMQTGVVEVNGSVYYFGEGNDGAMKTGTVEIDGQTYRFNENGEAIGKKPTVDNAFSVSEDGSVSTVTPGESTSGGSSSGSVIIPPVKWDVVEVTSVDEPIRDGGHDTGNTNIGKYTVSVSGNTITLNVLQTLSKHASEAGMGEAEWVGVLITTNVNVTDLYYNGTQLTEFDVSEAESQGKEDGKTFVLWMKAEDLRQADKVITLNADGKDKAVDVTIKLEEASESLREINAISEKGAMRTALEEKAEALGIDLTEYNTLDESRKPSVANYVLDSKSAQGFTSEAALKAAFDAGVAYESAKWDFSTQLMNNELTAADFEAIENAYDAHAAYRSSIGKSIANEATYKAAKHVIAYVLNAGEQQETIISALEGQFVDTNNNAAAGECTNPYRINDVFAWLWIHEIDGMMGALPESDSFEYADLSQYFAVRDAKYQMEETVKVAVSQLSSKFNDFYQNETNYGTISETAEKWWTNGNGVTVSKIEYSADAGTITITTSAEVKYVDTSRLFVNSGNGSVALNGVETSVDSTTITITLGDKAEAVSALVEAAGGVGNTWVHYGEGAFLVDKGVPNKGNKYDTSMTAAPAQVQEDEEDMKNALETETSDVSSAISLLSVFPDEE